MALRLFLALLMALPVAAPGADRAEPDLLLRVYPKMSLAAPGTVRIVMLTAEIVGPETEEYYCPEVVWVFQNGSRSSSESDCTPFEVREDYPRRFVRRVASPPRSRDHRVCVELRKAGQPIDRTCVRYKVR